MGNSVVLPASISTIAAGAATEAKQDVQTTSLNSIDAGIPAALGQTTMAASMPVVIASNQTAVPISAASLPLPTGAATETSVAAILGKYTSPTATLSNVSGSAVSVTLLALNTNRESAILVNDSTSACYVKFGSTASTTSFTYKLRSGDTLIIDGTPVYTGIITAIWDTATGTMRVTELT